MFFQLLCLLGGALLFYKYHQFEMEQRLGHNSSHDIINRLSAEARALSVRGTNLMYLHENLELPRLGEDEKTESKGVQFCDLCFRFYVLIICFHVIIYRGAHS